jgi:hypothetical protein
LIRKQMFNFKANHILGELEGKALKEGEQPANSH